MARLSAFLSLTLLFLPVKLQGLHSGPSDEPSRNLFPKTSSKYNSEENIRNALDNEQRYYRSKDNEYGNSILGNIMKPLDIQEQMTNAPEWQSHDLKNREYNNYPKITNQDRQEPFSPVKKQDKIENNKLSFGFETSTNAYQLLSQATLLRDDGSNKVDKNSFRSNEEKIGKATPLAENFNNDGRRYSNGLIEQPEMGKQDYPAYDDETSDVTKNRTKYSDYDNEISGITKNRTKHHTHHKYDLEDEEYSQHFENDYIEDYESGSGKNRTKNSPSLKEDLQGNSDYIVEAADEIGTSSVGKTRSKYSPNMKKDFEYADENPEYESKSVLGNRAKHYAHQKDFSWQNYDSDYLVDSQEEGLSTGIRNKTSSAAVRSGSSGVNGQNAATPELAAYEGSDSMYSRSNRIHGENYWGDFDGKNNEMYNRNGFKRANVEKEGYPNNQFKDYRPQSRNTHLSDFDLDKKIDELIKQDSETVNGWRDNSEVMYRPQYRDTARVYHQDYIDPSDNIPILENISLTENNGNKTLYIKKLKELLKDNDSHNTIHTKIQQTVREEVDIVTPNDTLPDSKSQQQRDIFKLEGNEDYVKEPENEEVKTQKFGSKNDSKYNSHARDTFEYKDPVLRLTMPMSASSLNGDKLRYKPKLRDVTTTEGTPEYDPESKIEITTEGAEMRNRSLFREDVDGLIPAVSLANDEPGTWTVSIPDKFLTKSLAEPHIQLYNREENDTKVSRSTIDEEHVDGVNDKLVIEPNGKISTNQNTSDHNVQLREAGKKVSDENLKQSFGIEISAERSPGEAYSDFLSGMEEGYDEDIFKPKRSTNEEIYSIKIRRHRDSPSYDDWRRNRNNRFTRKDQMRYPSLKELRETGRYTRSELAGIRMTRKDQTKPTIPSIKALEESGRYTKSEIEAMKAGKNSPFSEGKSRNERNTDRFDSTGALNLKLNFNERSNTLQLSPSVSKRSLDNDHEFNDKDSGTDSMKQYLNRDYDMNLRLNKRTNAIEMSPELSRENQNDNSEYESSNRNHRTKLSVDSKESDPIYDVNLYLNPKSNSLEIAPKERKRSIGSQKEYSGDESSNSAYDVSLRLNPQSNSLELLPKESKRDSLNQNEALQNDKNSQLSEGSEEKYPNSDVPKEQNRRYSSLGQNSMSDTRKLEANQETPPEGETSSENTDQAPQQPPPPQQQPPPPPPQQQPPPPQQQQPPPPPQQPPPPPPQQPPPQEQNKFGATENKEGNENVEKSDPSIQTSSSTYENLKATLQQAPTAIIDAIKQAPSKIKEFSKNIVNSKRSEEGTNENKPCTNERSPNSDSDQTSLNVNETPKSSDEKSSEVSKDARIKKAPEENEDYAWQAWKRNRPASYGL